MGVDYGFTSGIGVKIIAPDVKYDDNDEEIEFDFGEYLEEKLKDCEDFVYDEGGNYYNDDISYFVYIKNPFGDGYDISNKVEAFERFLNEKKIDYEGKVDLIGKATIS